MTTAASIPHPIPIIYGCKNFPDAGEMYAVTVRVIERGQPDIQCTEMVSGHAFVQDEYALRTVVDHCVRECQLLVGLRHGIWICHIVELPRYAFPSDLNKMPLPPIARILRRREPRDWRTVYREDRLDVTATTYFDELRDWGIR